MAPTETKPVATDFEKIIQAGRDRAKSQKLAARIFGRSTDTNRRASAPLRAASGGGIRKTSQLQQGGRSSLGARVGSGAVNSNGDWTHDLHERHAASKGAGSLASRISEPGAGPLTGPATRVRTDRRRAARVANALIKSELMPARQQQPSQQTRELFASKVPTGPAAQRENGAVPRPGMTIRGLAGPFVIRAQNFAPGTTAADIESAVTPIGGIVQSCQILKQHPIIVAELVLESKEGADNVISTFDKQTADGRVLSVYYSPTNVAQPPSGSRNQKADDMVVDGSMGFDDPMETEDDRGAPRGAPRGPAAGNNGRLYSDRMVGSSNNSSRGRGRGYQGGARGGPR